MAESRPWRAVDPDLFRFTTTDLAPLHVAVMAAFEQSAVLAPAMNLDQVRAALARAGWDEPTDDAVLHQTLKALTRWRLLEATQDHSARYATPEEFERKNLQWSLTPRGEAAVGGLLHAVEALRHAVGLQTAVLDAIGDDLGVLAELATRPRSAEVDARIHIQLAQIERHLTALVNGVRQFNGHLQRLLREDGTDDEVFADVKRRTVTYLEEYVTGVERPQRRLASAIERVESLGLATVFDRALSGANLAPVADDDPAPAWLADREKRWQALRAWFVPEGASPAQVVGLLVIARTAIVELLRVLERRWDSRRRSASIAHDFRALARWFAAAPGEREAHRLFAAAFGLWPARHAHLPATDGQARAPTSSWTETEPVEVAPALRTTGSLSNRGRTSPVADPRQVRAARQRAQAEALAAHDAVQEALTTEGMARLSSFGRLPAAEFAELLILLAAGLEAPVGTDGTRRALSADGRVEVVLSDPGDGRRAALTTDEGVLQGPDLLVSIRLVDDVSSAGGVQRSSAGCEETAAAEMDELEAASG
ncbi:MAG TPA: TIGR02677 family protein [Acidimicrobiales bacterium]|nr:TIGR02677 family protein [Acidimicrobiales bacterium]